MCYHFFYFYNTDFSGSSPRVALHSNFCAACSLEIMLLLIVYISYGAPGRSSVTYILLTFSSWFLAISWLWAPYIFNPSGFEWQKWVLHKPAPLLSSTISFLPSVYYIYCSPSQLTISYFTQDCEWLRWLDKLVVPQRRHWGRRQKELGSLVDWRAIPHSNTPRAVLGDST